MMVQFVLLFIYVSFLYMLFFFETQLVWVVYVSCACCHIKTVVKSSKVVTNGTEIKVIILSYFYPFHISIHPIHSWMEDNNIFSCN